MINQSVFTLMLINYQCEMFNQNAESYRLELEHYQHDYYYYTCMYLT